MTPEEEKLLKDYVNHRRETYSWKQFWIVMVPVIVIMAMYVVAVISILRDRS